MIFSFCSPGCQFKSLPVLSGAQSKSNSDGCAENSLDDCSIELDQQHLRQVELPELLQEVHPLLVLGLFDDWMPTLLTSLC